MRAFGKVIENENISVERKNEVVRSMISMFHENDIVKTPEMSGELHNLLKKHHFNDDPYKSAKKQNNDQALALVPYVREIIYRSDDPFNTAMRIAIAGNIMDFAAKPDFDLNMAIKQSISCEMPLDHSEQLRKAIARARSIVYLGDNAGEIVFDRLFIETINHPSVIFAVRGYPVINDATIEDAEYTGMNEVAGIVSNEHYAPSTILEKSGKKFRDYFAKADLIISKGQGNLEGLINLKDNRIYFLLIVKCDVMAEFLKVKKDSFVVYNPLLK